MAKIETILKIGMIISLLILFLSVSLLPKTPCDSCEFENKEGNKMTASQFIDKYYEVCIDPYREPQEPLKIK